MKKAFSRLFNDYFNFTKGERNGFFILLGLIVIVCIYPLLDTGISGEKPADFSKLDALAIQVSDSSGADDHESFQEYPERRASFTSRKFRFNPNTATVADLEQLGFRSYIAKRIEKYRGSGGKFRIKADLNKVYGIDQELVNSLWPLIDLPETFGKNAETDQVREQPLKYEASKTATLIDINHADTTELKSLPGIGSKLSRRIVDFRTKLGGFHSLEQLSEVYGLKPEVISSILPRLTIDKSAIVFLELNKADAKTLEAHPYIDWNQANAIVQYRKQHGDYRSVEDLSKVVVLNEALLNKIKNYLKF